MLKTIVEFCVQISFPSMHLKTLYLFSVNHSADDTANIIANMCSSWAEATSSISQRPFPCLGLIYMGVTSTMFCNHLMVVPISMKEGCISGHGCHGHDYHNYCSCHFHGHKVGVSQ
ncbi:hypothetical protein Nepgr_014313 [Nepenthes gracilis]|uniref:Uncharacterized protein n=1 Tax=Nepenthes gracilis TaxID=150966 RepID=A0AAD3SJT7_NEPGR|nr:hypothetical protein Nepgr_014313 [Nepenthes gracilis]